MRTHTNKLLYEKIDMDILQEIKESWGWTGIDPVEIVAENEFANYILKDSHDRFWRLCPEDVYCEVIAENSDEYKRLTKNEEFSLDWFMASMVEEAVRNVGPLLKEHKYYMVIPGPLGGEYGGSNVKSVPAREIIKFSGDLGLQVKDFPEGAEIKFKVIE